MRRNEVVDSCVDNTAMFGEVLYALPFGKAIEKKLLTDYRVVIIGVDDPTIALWIANRELVTTGTGIETDSESLAAQIGLLKAIKDYDLKRIISFHSRVNRAETFTTDTAVQSFNVLCKNGPFPFVGQQMFGEFLRSLGDQRLIMQASDGLLLHGQLGERLVNHYSFYTVFVTPEEYRLVSGDQTLGTLPIDRPVAVDSLLIFGGRRWLVVEVDSAKKVIVLKPSKGGVPPKFGGQAGWIHDRIRQEMFAVYMEKNVPVFLDTQAKGLLAEARENFNRFDLAKIRILPQGSTTYLFCWMGDRVMDTLAAMLRAKGMKAANEGIAIVVTNVSPDEVQKCLCALQKEGLPDVYELARSVVNKATEKYDLFLTDELLSADYAASKLDAEGAFKAVKELMANGYEN